MFNYLFPIFGFGLVICGIVYLGIVEAAKQAKSLSISEAQSKTTVTNSDDDDYSQKTSSRLTVRSLND